MRSAMHVFYYVKKWQVMNHGSIFILNSWHLFFKEVSESKLTRKQTSSPKKVFWRNEWKNVWLLHN